MSAGHHLSRDCSNFGEAPRNPRFNISHAPPCERRWSEGTAELQRSFAGLFSLLKHSDFNISKSESSVKEKSPWPEPWGFFMCIMKRELWNMTTYSLLIFLSWETIRCRAYGRRDLAGSVALRNRGRRWEARGDAGFH